MNERRKYARSLESKERQRERQRIASAAVHAADKRLRAAHPAEWERYHDEEAQVRGVLSKNAQRQQRVERLRAELAALEGGGHDA